jgi:hypothetical protein
MAKLNPPKYDDARQAFAFAVTHGSADIQGIREWYWLEKDSGFSVFKPMEVCDLVLKLKGQSAETKAEFLSKKGLAYRDLAVQTFAVDPEKSLSYMVEALTHLLDAQEVPLGTPDRDRHAKTREWLAEAFRFLFICAGRALAAERTDLVQIIFNFFLAEARRKIHHFDAAELPAIECLRLFGKAAVREGAGRYRGFVQRLTATFDVPFKLRFRNEDSRRRIMSAAQDALARMRAS